MIQIADTSPDTQVAPAEYLRLLGYPAGHALNGRAAELAEWARDWYTRNGRPWVYARDTDAVELSNGSVRIEGAAFHSARLRQSFQEAGADRAVLAAASAGPEAEREAQRLWSEEKPDEYFFLETYASAVTEHLITRLGARLCVWAEDRGAAILPHYSPGYSGWDISEQPRLLALAGADLPGSLETLDSGALRPKKSLLAVFGVTCDANSLFRLAGGVPCVNCSYHPCQFRRAPYGRAAAAEPQAPYTVNPKALDRWTSQRLRLTRREDGTIDAQFHYDGTTCTNMGRPLAFEYFVKLGPKAEGFPVREQRCTPAPGDTGHRHMCQYIAGADDLMGAIEREKPLAGKPLHEVLDWRRPPSPAGCYCDSASRDHKWGLVLETIHYALRKSGDL